MKKILLIALVLMALTGCQSVGTTDRGVVTKWGAVTGEVKEPGLHWFNPFVTKIVNFDISINRLDVEAAAASKDLQNVSFLGAVNYQILPEKVLDIYKNVQLDLSHTVIKPALQEAIKSVTAQYTAEELITRREEVKDKIKASLIVRLAPYGVNVIEFNIVNFNFSASFNEAIENKVSAEQNALASKNKLEQVKYESEQKVAEAKGKAEALRVESEAISSDPKILELRAIEKWNGILPTQMIPGGSLPFIGLNK